MSIPKEKFVYFYGSLVAERFHGVSSRCRERCGVAAMKLLRSLYEHTVGNRACLGRDLVTGLAIPQARYGL